MAVLLDLLLISACSDKKTGLINNEIMIEEEPSLPAAGGDSWRTNYRFASRKNLEKGWGFILDNTKTVCYDRSRLAVNQYASEESSVRC